MDRRLYGQDFYLWTQAQAEALRAEAARPGGHKASSNAIDWDLVAVVQHGLSGADTGRRRSRRSDRNWTTTSHHLSAGSWRRLSNASMLKPPNARD